MRASQCALGTSTPTVPLRLPAGGARAARGGRKAARGELSARAASGAGHAAVQFASSRVRAARTEQPAQGVGHHAVDGGGAADGDPPAAVPHNLERLRRGARAVTVEPDGALGGRAAVLARLEARALRGDCVVRQAVLHQRMDKADHGRVGRQKPFWVRLVVAEAAIVEPGEVGLITFEAQPIALARAEPDPAAQPAPRLRLRAAAAGARANAKRHAVVARAKRWHGGDRERQENHAQDQLTCSRERAPHRQRHCAAEGLGLRLALLGHGPLPAQLCTCAHKILKLSVPTK